MLFSDPLVWDSFQVKIAWHHLVSTAVSIFDVILVVLTYTVQYLSIQPIYLQILRRQCCLVTIKLLDKSFHILLVIYPR